MDAKNQKNKQRTKKSNLFSFARINKYFIFPFLSPICCFLGNLFLGLLIDNRGTTNLNFLISMIESTSCIVGGLLYFVSWIRTRTEETRDEAIEYRTRSTSSIAYIYNNAEKKSIFKIFIILFIMSILLNLFFLSSLFGLDNYVFEDRLYLLFFIPVFSKIILKTKIFNHQILSLYIAFIGLILLFVPVIIKFEKKDIFINICIFVTAIGFSLFLVLCRYVTQYLYISPYLCILYIGFISTLTFLIGFPTFSLIKYHNLSLITDSFKIEETNLSRGIFALYFFSALIFASALQTLTILVVYYFSPTLFILTDIISPLLTWITKSIRNGEKSINICLKSLGFFIVFFSSLIYNEIIICNFWNLEKNTKKYIEEREKEELQSLRVTENGIQNANQETNDNESSFYSENIDNDFEKDEDK